MIMKRKVSFHVKNEEWRGSRMFWKIAVWRILVFLVPGTLGSGEISRRRTFVNVWIVLGAFFLRPLSVVYPN